MGTLRLILAMSVVLGHGAGYMSLIPFSGNAAVYCFFVISGFYMSLILNEKYLGAGAAWRFYTNRILRLFPTYLVVLPVVASYRGFAHPEQFHFLVDSSISLLNRGLVVIANLTTIGIDHYRYSYEQMRLPNIDDWRLIPQAWSLEPELIFYAIAPFVLRRLNVCKALVFLGVAVTLFVNQRQIEANGSWFLLSKYLAFFAAGPVCYLWYKRMPARMSAQSMAITLGLGAIVLTASYLYRLDLVDDPIAWPYLPLYAATAILVPHAFLPGDHQQQD